MDISASDMGNTPGARPCGILEVESGQVSFAMNTGTTTSDSNVDALEYWWQLRGFLYPETRTLMIDLDNGPDVASNRSVFIKRLTQFADRVGLKIELVYYPPYHNKYNAVERFGGKMLECLGASLERFDTAND